MAGSNQTQETVARLIQELRRGEPEAVDQLFGILYDELKELAGRQRRRWQGHYTLNTTALLHEAYVKLVGQSRIEVEDRAHFRALAAQAMRHILCDYARDRTTRKRGGDLETLPLDPLNVLPDPVAFTAEQSHKLLALDDALARLEAVDPRQARVVECRFFGGLTIDETAAALDISPRTVKRDWAMAQAWLHREIGPGP
jgi:RNA polymerase sigma factor (TIGR02999 family)